MLNKGDVPATWEPYTGAKPAPSPDYPQEIVSVTNPAVTVCGKNLVDLNKVKNQEWDIITTSYKKIAICLEPNQSYTFSISKNNFFGSGNYCILTNYAEYDGYSLEGYKYMWIGHTGSEGLNQTRATFTTSSDGIMYLAVGGNNLGQVYKFLPNAQLEKGTTATTYEPYTGHTVTLTDITLRSLPDGTADKLEKRDGVWGIERATKTITLDGTQRAGKWNDATESHIYSYIQAVDLDCTKNLLCRELTTVMSYPEIYLNDFAVMPGKSSNGTIFALVFKVPKSIAATPEAFQTWIATNNLHVQYALATPTWEPLSDALQAELNKLESHAGTTNIFTDSALQPAMKAEYIQDPNKVISDITTELTSIKEQIVAMQA